ncbi:hypothetical protein NLU13_3565 [Sarocladium strictum]|uniref:Plasma membrane fusion protein PRM1 n=1 Tax=Sarocladium strictum TaxID=5046 RepID=A0AA39GMA5_SARSR|nr:hypothetical protein NLU13_3565 [Sarocladium strictum]
MFFSSRKKEDNTTYPEVPDSLRGGTSFEENEMRKVREARADTSPSLTPYLGLRSRLSQIWLNRWTILLLLVLVRVVLLIAQLKDNVGDAKSRALSACTKVEDIGSAMASMPHYLSVGVNSMAAHGIETAVHALVITLDLMLQGVEGIIIFFINFLTATYVCLITALVHGSLDAVASVTEDATKAFNNIIDKASGEISDIAGSLEDGINDLTKGIKDSVFGGLVPDIPKVDFSKPIDELKDFDLNSNDFVKDVRKLNDDLPNFDEVQNMTKEAIAIPFNFVREKLNETYGDWKFDRSVFPLAQKESMTFCSDNDTINDFFQGLYDLIHKARIIFIVLLVVLAVAVIIPMAWMEIKRWRRQQQHARLVTANAYDPMDVIYISSRPMTSTSGIKIASRFSGKRQIMVRWCIAYGTSLPAIFVLSLAIAGLVSCLCQYVLLQAVRNEVPKIANEVGEFADDVVGSLKAVSDKWAADANGVIIGLNDDVNDDVLRYVKNATDAVNDTLTVFLDTMNDGLNTVFNGTILLDPIKTVLHCVIGIKIESVQSGLTWVHDHANVSFPLFDNDTFSEGAQKSIEGDNDLYTFLASPSDVTTDEVTGAVDRVVNWLEKGLIQDALISTGLLLVYVIVVLMGIVRMLAGMAMPDKGHGDSSMRYTGDDRPALSPRGSQNEWNDSPHNFDHEKAAMSGAQPSQNANSTSWRGDGHSRF